MHKSSLYIIWLSCFTGIISVLYFLSLILLLPVWITTILIIVSGYSLHRWLFKQCSLHQQEEPFNTWANICLLAGVVIITNKVYYLSMKYGAWDAWWFWNYRAKYLSQPGNWRQTYLTAKIPHADYPLYYPATTAFFWRLFHTQSQVIPFGISFLFTLVTPVLIFLETHRKNLLIAFGVLLYFSTDEAYLLHGTWQLADIIIAFFLLAVLVCLTRYKQAKQKSLLTLTGILLGLCLWTKNEGILIFLLVTIFYFRDLFLKANPKYFLTGLIPPLVILILFKSFYSTTNDIIGGQGAGTLHNLFDVSRYRMFWDFLVNYTNGFYGSLKYGLLAYLLLCIVTRKMPRRGFWLLLAILCGYMFVYILSPHDLEWHLATSLDRLILQLIPAFAYIFSLQLVSIITSFRSKKIAVDHG